MRSYSYANVGTFLTPPGISCGSRCSASTLWLDVRRGFKTLLLVRMKVRWSNWLMQFCLENGH